MLLQRLPAALVGGLAIGVAAKPVRNPQDAGAVRKREVPASHVLHECSMPHWERTWERKNKMPADAVLPMRIGLQQPNLQSGHERLMDM